jgi:hypothetical protein
MNELGVELSKANELGYMAEWIQAFETIEFMFE